MSPITSDLLREIEQLRVEARRAYASPRLQFFLVAIPYQPPVSQGIVRWCKENSPDVGQIRDGVFHWPYPITPYHWIRDFGQARIGDRGVFDFMAIGLRFDAQYGFEDFSGRAAAALLAAAPAWFDARSPGDAITTWAATVIFGAPSVLSYADEQRTGALILNNPWAASITALNDILTPPDPILLDDDPVDPPNESESTRKPGRPLDPIKQEVVKYVRELRANNTPWKDIPDAVFKKFGVRYTPETLRGYLKSG